MLGDDGRPQIVFDARASATTTMPFRRERTDGRIFYTVAGEIFDTDKSEPTDIYAVEHGYIADAADGRPQWTTSPSRSL